MQKCQEDQASEAIIVELLTRSAEKSAVIDSEYFMGFFKISQLCLELLLKQPELQKIPG